MDWTQWVGRPIVWPTTILPHLKKTRLRRVDSLIIRKKIRRQVREGSFGVENQSHKLLVFLVILFLLTCLSSLTQSFPLSKSRSEVSLLLMYVFLNLSIKHLSTSSPKTFYTFGTQKWKFSWGYLLRLKCVFFHEPPLIETPKTCNLH